MDPKATIGSSAHKTGGSTPSSPITSAPRAIPIVVPARARTTVVPVPNALLLSTERAPRTIHGPFWTGNTKVISTASAIASPVRTLFSTVIDPVLR